MNELPSFRGYGHDVTGSTTRVSLKAGLLDAYGIEVHRLQRHPFGFESECWIADYRWFVKVWRHDPPGNLALLERRPSRARRCRCGHAMAHWPPQPRHTATRSTHTCTVVPRPGPTGPRSLETVIELASSVEQPGVLCHNDLIGDNLLIGDDGRVVAMLDWDHAEIAPCEHDVWIATEGPMTTEFLRAYGAVDLNPTHLEYALLRRAVGDLAARIADEVDRPGIETWGFERWRNLERNLDLLTR